MTNTTLSLIAPVPDSLDVAQVAAVDIPVLPPKPPRARWRKRAITAEAACFALEAAAMENITLRGQLIAELGKRKQEHEAEIDQLTQRKNEIVAAYGVLGTAADMVRYKNFFLKVAVVVLVVMNIFLVAVTRHGYVR